MQRFTRTILLLCMMWLTTASCFAVSDSDHLLRMKVDDNARVITVYMDDAFAAQNFTEKSVKKTYKKISKDLRKALPKECRKYDVRIMAGNRPLESLVSKGHNTSSPDIKKRRRGGWWGSIGYDGNPWVTNTSLPHSITNGLNDRHISLWASHGRFYDGAKGLWRWQRPNMFCTTEDLFTQTIVVPYLIPMLERAGANVFTPRERDWQTQEVVVDNKSMRAHYREENLSGKWSTVPHLQGFAMPQGNIEDGVNPFSLGTVRQTHTTSSDEPSMAIYQPQIPEAGRYAVYVSYATVEKSVEDAHYSVYHKGQRTDFIVNQRMGGGTWVYLGTFDFDEGCNEANRVVVSALSQHKGIVTTDAVRFGGGKGNISRGGSVSGMPRCLEGARYYAQWAGMPYETYSLYKGADDYKDDINVRSLMTNWLAGGSAYNPSAEGKNVPIDLALGLHTDAGYNADMQSIYGSLTICTTNHNDGKLATDRPRSHSKDLARRLLNDSQRDISARYGSWTARDLWDKNYSETRLPAMPSAIFEMLSHQSFPDMMMAHDPDFKFTLARSIYKSILRHEAEAHGTKAVVAPLQPENFSISLSSDGRAILTWVPQEDSQEKSATPSSYNVYMATGNGGFDNGTNVKQNSFITPLVNDVLYRFRITAVNSGGESFPTEELCVLWHGAEAKSILIVNGFQRLSGPAVRNTASEKGFDIYEDPGVSYGITAGWAGVQEVYDISTAGKEGAGNFSYSSNDMAGLFVAGNSFNYVTEHANAIAQMGRYNIVSTSRDVAEWGGISLTDYACIDLILGNERNDGHSLRPYKTFSPQLRERLLEYKNSGRGALLVSGSYVASDMQSADEQSFLSQLLSCGYGGTVMGTNNTVRGLQQTLAITNILNPRHYATTRSDVLTTTGNGFIAMQYADGQTAAVAVRNTFFPTFTMGFPLECITSPQQQALVMRGIINFLIQ